MRRHATRFVWAILLGGLVAGALDLLSAFATLTSKTVTEIGILHYVASGLIGASAFTGGTATALLGVAVHFGLTLIMAAVFVAIAAIIPALLRRPWLWGLVYGLVTYLVMTRVAAPLSAANWKNPQGWAVVAGLLAHCFYVGVPIAFIARHFMSADTRR
jgi:hypothetical protein